MLNTNWRDLYDRRSGTRVRVSPEVLEHLGPDGVRQVALHLKGRDPEPTRKGATLATAYGYRANGLDLVAGLFVLEEPGGPVPVFLIATRAQWEQWHLDRQRRN